MAGVVTRFAPSPTGPLHLGHAYAAIVAHDMARQAGGQFLLRIEDIDQSRARPQWEQGIYDDLAWLGLTWDGPVMRQSARLPAYHAALAQLWAQGLLYLCTCSRRDIAAALSAPQEGAMGPDGPIYPGTCRPKGQRCASALPDHGTLRLNMTRALEHLGPQGLTFHEGLKPPCGTVEILPETLIHAVGDVVLARVDMGTSYHLSVVIDDAAAGITDVTRGQDLCDATQIHVVLQRLLSISTPNYHHHRLIRDDHGKRLAKRDDARALAKYRAEGATPADIRALCGLTTSAPTG